MVYHKKLLNILVLLGFFQKNLVGSFTQLLQASPCPHIFQYEFENGNLIGRIQIDCPGCRKIQLNVELCVGNRVEGYNGNIQLAQDKQQVLRDILNKNPIYYKVYFPMWQGTQPKITKILINGNLICSGPKLHLGMVPVLTTINLQHTLTVDTVPLSTSADSPAQNLPVPDPPFDVRRLPQSGTRTPNDDPTFDESPFYSPPPPGKNGFTSDNKYNFRPQMPKNPNKIYPGNPFLTGLASTAPPTNRFPAIDNNVDGFSVMEVEKFYPNNPYFSRNFLFGRLKEFSADNNQEVVGSTDIPKDLNKTTNPVIVFNGLSSFNTTLVENIEDANKPNNPFLSQRTSERPPVSKAPNVELIPSRSDGKIPFDDTCGRTISTNSLIINGNSVPKGAFPWLVAIFGVKDTGLNYMCSGSLISKRHVVTAAHCVKTEAKRLKPQELLCILGKLNIKKWVPADGEKMIEPEKIDIHPSYETMTSDADIAVLTLSEDVEFNKYIRPLCLWTEQNGLAKVVGRSGTVVGWGKDENGKLMTEEPKQINLPIVSQEQCLRSNYQFQYITSNRTFCAGFRNGTGPCNGDSGSGFIMQEDGRWMLRGIVSMSISESHTRTCDLSNYVVFTDASKYLDWLLSFIK